MRRFNPTRVLLASVVLFILVFAGVQLYTWQVRRTGEAELAQTKQLLSHFEKKKETHTAQGADITTQLGPSGKTEEALLGNSTETMSTERTALPQDNAAKGPETAVSEESSAFQTETEGVVAADFPEVPADFPENLTPVWIEFPNYRKGDMRDHEMIYRVLIKLWNQGDRGFVNGIFRDNNERVYPLYMDVIYVRWDEENVGSDENPRMVPVPKSMLGAQSPGFTMEERLSGRLPELYPDIRFVDIETAGYDPETFLTNAEK